MSIVENTTKPWAEHTEKYTKGGNRRQEMEKRIYWCRKYTQRRDMKDIQLSSDRQTYIHIQEWASVHQIYELFINAQSVFCEHFKSKLQKVFLNW